MQRELLQKILLALPFLEAYADVTDIVAANGNGTYTLSNLDLTRIIFIIPQVLVIVHNIVTKQLIMEDGQLLYYIRRRWSSS